MKNKSLRKPIFILASLLFWIGVWWVIAAAFAKPLLLPTPPAVAGKLLELMKTGSFWLMVATSLVRILIGILLALFCGAMLALLTSKVAFFHHLFSPLLTLFKATPVASVIFLMLLWIGRERVPLVIAFMMALPIVWSNLQEGLLHTDRKLLEMAQLFRLPRSVRLWRIRVPCVMPYFFSACRSAISLAWKAGVAAEVLCTPENSIGRAIYEGKLYLLTDELFAYTLTVILLSVAIEGAALALLRLGERPRKEKDRAQAT